MTGQLLIDGMSGDIFTGISSEAVVGSSGEAGSVFVTVEDLAIVQNGAEISTRSANNQSGPVQVNTGSILLRNSVISTTTDSDLFSGGEITIGGKVLILDSGGVQANAVSGQGGQIAINSAIIGSANQLIIGGTVRVPFQFDGPNVLQAVAPTGITVPPDINAPNIDVSGSLSGLDTNFVDTQGLAADPCAEFVDGAPSTMVIGGKGGLQQQFYEFSFDISNAVSEFPQEQARDIRHSQFANVAYLDEAMSRAKLSCHHGRSSS